MKATMKKAYLFTLLFFWTLLHTTSLFAETLVLPSELTIYPFPTAELMVPCPGGSGTIGGNAFQDFNYNGLDDQLGARLDGIEVHLFTCTLAGESEQVGTAVTDKNGDYFFSSLVDGQEYRVEFTPPTDLSFLASGFNETDSRTTVQFVTSPTCDVHIGLANPDDFCEEDPLLIIPCYVNGDPMATGSLSATEDAMVAFNISNSGTNPKPISIAKAQEIGATWGVTYNKSKKTVYTSAFLKRHVGFGPLGIGGIYQIDMNGATPVVSPLIDLAAIGANIGTYIDNGSRDLSADINLPSNDTDAFDQVGKKGLGGLTMSTDGKTLYVISLTDQTVYAIDISAGTAPTSANLSSYPIPDPGCTGGAFRPFAIQIHNEELYVGGVCDAETSGQKSDLRSIVYRLDGTTFTEVLNFSLDFQKGLASRSCNEDRGWFPWSSTVPESCFKSGTSNIIVHPTPILSDIEFDGNGDMYLGYMDRIGNQLGYQNYGPTGQTELYSAFTGGDLLKAGINEDGSFTLENNATVGPNTTVGVDNGEGPGGGEFFSFDVFEVAPGIPRPHSETAQGGLALIKGSNQVIGTALDPFGTFVNSGGVNYWNIETGEVRDPGYVIFRSGSNSIATFSKANGLGDVSTLCSAAPIELGGRLWVDANTNGVQDPCEGALSAIEISLYNEQGVVVGTQITDVNGEYYFNNATLTTGAITPNTSYTVVIGSAEQTKTPLALLDIYTPTARGLGMSPNNSLNDSDVRLGTIAGITNAFIIPIMTGGMGSVSHSNDAGFFEIPPPPVANISGQVFNDLNQNGLQGNNEPFIGSVSVTLFNADGTEVATTMTDVNGQYIFEDILKGEYYIEIDYETNIDGIILNYDGTIQDAGNDAIDSDFNPATGQTNTISFDPAAGDQDFDAGIFQPEGVIEGKAFKDVNGDGIQDANESFINGVSVTLQDCAGGVVKTTTTDATGKYSFGELVAGNYQVFFDVSTNSENIDNYTTAPQNAGTDASKDSDISTATNTSECISFNPKTGAIIDAGFLQPTGTIIGTVKEDPNQNGVQEVDEPALGGILVKLVDCNGVTVATTTTDANGQYSFGDIVKGDYEIIFDASSNFNNIDNYLTSPQNVGDNDAIDFDIDPTTNSSSCISFDPDIPTTIDAGFFQPTGALTGNVFEDLNEDGLQDVGEPFIEGISIYLASCDGTLLDSTLTNSNGVYSFGDLLKGDYQIIFGTYNTVGLYQYIITKQDVGNDDTIDSDANADTGNSTCIAFDPAQGADVDAGYIKPTGTATGTVFEDLDGDGIRDPDEGALLGVEVSLANCDRVIIATTITNEDGSYTFEGIKEGDYQIIFGPPKDGYGFEYLASPPNEGDDEDVDSDIDPETNATVCITFAPNQKEDIDAGYFPVTGPLFGLAFEDTNRNGIQDAGEIGIPGIGVTLADCNGNEAATITTDIDGKYEFSSLTAGEYQILFNPRINLNGIDNFKTSPQNQGGNDRVDSDIDTLTNTSHCFILNPYEGAAIDGGFFQPTGIVTGTTFEDTDKDGVQGVDEPFIGGITVRLMDCNGTTIATTTTDPSGNYSFGDLLKEDYVVAFDISTNLNGILNYTPTTPNIGTNDAIDSDINTSGNSECSMLDPDEGLDIDAGFIQPTGTITGTTFKDVDKDGIQDVNEPFIGGIKVSLMDCNGTSVATTTTDANGNYTFEEVLKGTYIVVFDVSTNLDGIDNYISSPQDAGTNDAIDSDINNAGASTCIDFDPDNGVDIDAGFIQPTGTISGTTFDDTDKDGIQEEDKKAIEGITVNLMDCNGTTIATTLTDANGDYSFEDIPKGNYIVVFDVATNLNNIDNYIPSPQNVGDNDAIDSDINTNSSSDCITFDPDEGIDVDAGFIQPTGTITGATFDDTNKDGIQDVNESFIEGVKVSLMDCNGAIIATTATDANGVYSFGDVLKGNYSIVFDVSTNSGGIDNYVISPKDVGANDAIDSDIATTGASDCMDFDPDTGADIDAGFIQPTGTITGTAFDDTDKDGIQDPNEPFIGGVQVSLMDCSGTTIATTTTDANGDYSFGDVLKGTYTIVFDVSTNSSGIDNYISAPKDAGTNDTRDSDITSAGASDCTDFDPDRGLDIDAGFIQPTGTITGSTFEDTDEDGIQDVDEPFIGGINVTLRDCNGITVATTTTDFNGSYSFGDLLKGSYIVSFDVITNLNGIDNYKVAPQNAGTNDALDSDINNSGDSECINFDPDTGIDVDAGFIEPTGDITGVTFEDEDEDGIRDPNEGGIPNIPVSLVDCSNNIIATTQTDDAGNYTFAGVKKGDYVVVFGVPKDDNGFDYLISPKDVGTDDTKDSDIDPTTKRTDCFSFDPETGANTDIGIYPPTGELTGIAFEDINKNGLFDSNEPLLENITVTLTNCNNPTPIATTVTTATGGYSFDNLLSGIYQVSFNTATNTKGIPNYTPSQQGVASTTKKNSDIHTITNASDCITFNPLEGAEVDAGFFQPIGEITGNVFEDLDVDGFLDIDDPGIVGVTINLLDCDGNIISTTTTDFNGDYTFKDLPLGSYQVVFNTSTNVLGISNFFASPEGKDSDIRQITNDTECLPFDPDTGSNIDAGFFQPTGIVEGTVFQDMDHDGMQEPGESSIGGVTVRLVDCNNVVIATTTTDNNGNYEFDMVKAGNYQVVFDPSTNNQLITDYMTSPANRGDDSMDSDIDPTTNTTICFAFDPMKDADIDAGFYQPIGELMGTIFQDINEDGMQDVGELGIAGVTVVLLDNTGAQIALTTANQNGNYFFTDVVSGTYQIFVDPSSNLQGMNYVNSPKDQGNDAFDSDINPVDNKSDIFTFIAAVGADIDAGFYQPASPISIGDLVFKDCNKNGLLDAGEVGLQGIIVMLSGENDLGDVINRQTTTNATGNYRFNMDRPGTFRVTFVIPSDLAGVEFSPQNVGTDEAKDSDADAAGVIERLVVNNGEQLTNVDVGLIDIAAPRIFNVPPDVTVSCDNIPDAPVSVKGVDNCDPTVNVSFKEEITQAGCPQTIVRTWTSADDCGNSTEKQQTITVIDEEAPVITLSNPLLAGIPNGGEVTFDCDNMPEFDETDVIVTDNCDDDIKIDFLDLVRVEGNCEADGFLVKMTCGWKAIDDCGNESEYVITITVVDTKAPIINNFPDDLTINLDAGQPIPAAPTNVMATDNCDETVSLSYEQTETAGGPCGYEIMRTWTARDNCGNKSTDTQTINVLKDCTCPETLTDGMMVQNAACDGSVGGMILLNLTANAQYYEFDFVPNLGDPNFLGNVRNNIPPGNYTVTITYKGAEDCKETLNISVGTLEAAEISIADSKKADCFMANGFIALAPATFTYEWSDGIIAAQRGDLAAGTYKVNHTDNLGCKGSTTVTVEEPDNCACLNFKFTSTENISPTCPGVPNGLVIIGTIGGKETIRYEWSNGTMGTELRDVPAGMYSVTATDANGCQIQQEVMVMDPESLAATISQSNGACGEKGTIDLYVRGGTMPYTYQWSNGAVGEDLLSVESGVYEVTIQDANSCTTTAAAMINNGDNIVIDLAKQLPTCNGNSDGMIRATISGGTAPYRYLWSNGATTKNLSNIGKGAYNVVVTDAKNCQSTSQIEVEEPTELNLVLTPSLPGCDGGTGSINAAVTGGTAPYTYKWDFGATSKNVSNVSSGAYSLTVTDANGCETIGIVFIDIPAPLAVFTTIQNPLCRGSLGAIELTIEGGVAPFQYQWDNGSTTKDIRDLAPATYTVVVSDARGCSATALGIISEPKLMEIRATATKTICDRGGDITISITNGTAPFTYNWSNGATTKNLSNVVAGTYTGTVTDANGCGALVQADIEQTTDLNIVLSPTLPGCDGGTGSIDVSVTGGLAPYSYAWDFGSNSKDVSGLAAGTYSVIVTDANACKITGTATLDIPSPLAVSTTIQGIACSGGAGAIELTVEGGVAPFQYQWDNGSTTKDIRDLAPGNYTIVVMDARGCTAATSGMINEPAAIIVQPTTTRATCDRGGDITISVTNGVAPFTYNWSNGATTKNLSNVAAGTYTGTVTDASACGALVQATIEQTTDLNIVLTPTLPGCDGGTGSIGVTVTGGLTPYSYAWDFGSTSKDVSGLAAGTYSVIVTDANGCKISGSATLDIPLPLAVYTTIQGINCIGALGAIDLTVEGGVAPFQYQWSFGSTSKNITGLTPNAYTVSVSDARGCTATTTAIINEPPPAIVVTATTTEAGCGSKGGDVSVSLTNGKGPFTFLWNNGANTKDLINVPAGTYEGTVTDENGCSAIVIGTVTSSANINGNAEATTPSCVGAQDGAITVNYSGGTAPIQFKWNTGATTQNLTDIGAGVYSVTITDAQQCSFVIETRVSNPAAIVITEKNQSSAICEAADGALAVVVSGGMAPYTYQWTNGATTDRLKDVVSGNYSVTVTDSKGCTATQNFIIENDCTCPTPLYNTVMINKAKCGESNGSIMIMVDHPERYTFEWFPNIGISGANPNERTNLPPGTYDIRITYARQEKCSEIINVLLGNREPTLSTVVSNTPADCDKDNGQVELMPANSTYQWSDGVLGSTRKDLAAGYHTIQVTDVNGCKSSLEVTVRRSACLDCDISAVAKIVRSPICATMTGDIVVEVTGGAIPMEYKWDIPTAGNNPHVQNVAPGTYHVTVVDANGCGAVSSVYLLAPDCAIPEVGGCKMILSMQTVNAKCVGEANGTVGVNVLDGKPPFLYNWSNGNFNQHLENIPAGHYTVTVTDANNCTATGRAEVKAPTQVSFQPTVNFLDCNKAAVSLVIQGGTKPYKWMCNGLEGSEYDPIHLVPGTYTCTVMDNSWCSSEQTITVAAINDPSCTNNSNSNGSIAAFQFTSFAVSKLSEAAVSLDWTTQYETQSGNFLIQHSTDGISFEVLGNLIPADGPIAASAYQRIMDLTIHGYNYFQIKYVDDKGQSVLSAVQEVFKKLPREMGRALLYPNPIIDNFTIDFLTPLTEDKQLIITNSLGTTTEIYTIPVGTIKYELNAADYRPGVYNLIVDNHIEKDIVMRLVKVEW